jgi:hypothetical protein
MAMCYFLAAITPMIHSLIALQILLKFSVEIMAT